MKNILFEEKNLRRIFYASVFVAVAFLLMSALLIYPAYMRLISDRANEESSRIARHLGSDVFHEGVMLQDSMHYKETTDEFIRDFSILKIKVFSSTGEVSFSTDKEDLGQVNKHPYFKEFVAKGKEYSKLVKKSDSTLEGQTFDRHVVETYIPFMHEGRFLGAVEIYYDVTASVNKLHSTMLATSAISLIVMAAFVLVIGGLLLNVDRGIKTVHDAEVALISYKDSLEDQVEQRTADLRVTNEELELEITERRHGERALRESESFLSSIFDSIHDPFCIFDSELTIMRANEGYAQLKGRSLDTLTGNQCFRVLEGTQNECASCVVRDTFNKKEPRSKQKQVALSSGEKAWVEILTYPIFSPEEDVKYVVEYTRDVTSRVEADEERKKLIEDLETLSRTDPLTCMLNRRAVNTELEQEFWRARRYGHDVSVIVSDIDFFKDINDTLGHAVGDSTLLKVAEAICLVLRQSDAAGRYGGDEFLVVLPETGSSGAMDTSERLRLEVSEIRRVPKGKNVTLSLGVATISESDEKPSDLVVRADLALYASKQGGRNRSTLATEDSATQKKPTQAH